MGIRHAFQGLGLLLAAALVHADEPAPDLTIHAPATNPRIETRTFVPEDCEVVEGCIVAGTRRLLRFNTETHNIGTADLYLGDPSKNPLFIFSPCHAHYHFEAYMKYRLRNSQDEVVAVGNKAGFCLLDSIQVDPGAGGITRYNCQNQGIHKGWGDIYTASLPCQYIDITNIPGGSYKIEMEVDPEHLLGDRDYSNNLVQVPVEIPDPVPPPVNDLCLDAIPLCPGVPRTGSTASATNDGNSGCGDATGRPDVWFSYTPMESGIMTVTTCGSTFDTVVSVHTGCPGGGPNQLLCNDDADPADVESCGNTFYSSLSIGSIAGQTLYIRLTGYSGAVGNYQIAVTEGNGCITPSPTPSPSPSPSPTPLPTGPEAGDFDSSGCTDLGDFLYVLDNWFVEVGGTLFDLDEFLALLDHWQMGATCPAPLTTCPVTGGPVCYCNR